MSAHAPSSYEHFSSSPDPLNHEVSNFPSSPTKSPRLPNATPPSKPNNGLIRFEDLLLTTPPRTRFTSSPTKTQAQSENLISPWRIRVTVEAEREDDEDSALGEQAAIKRTRSVIQKIPLRGGDSSPTEQKSARARPRDAGIREASPKKGRRSGTPVRKSRRSVTDLDVTVLGSDSDDVASRPKSRRKSKTRKTENNISSMVEDVEASEPTLQVKAAASGGKVKTQRRKTSRNFEIAVDSDADGIYEEGSLNAATSPAERVEGTLLNAIDTNVQIARGKGKQMDVGSTKASRGGPRTASKDISVEQRRISGSYPSPDASVEDEVCDDDAANGDLQRSTEEDGSILCHDPTDEHHEFDSILESEGFSMISLDSISSAKQHLSSPLSAIAEADHDETHHTADDILGEHKSESPAQPSPVTISLQKARSAIPSYLGTDDSEISSTMPSSPPMFPTALVPLLPAQHTPSAIHSSPKLPSPPKQASPLIRASRECSGTPKLARVVRAGIALQGVLEPSSGNRNSPRNSVSAPRRLSSANIIKEQSPKERIDDLFVGFDSGTRRELRAGLRLGEELAKRQKQKEEQRKSSSSSPAAGKQTQDLESVMDVEYPTLPDVAEKPRQDATPRSMERQGTPNKGVETPSRLQLGNMSEIVRGTEKLDRIWQLEREAVSREIDMASTSKVIVIDSDDEEEEEEPAYNSHAAYQSKDEAPANYEQDIWLMEAHDSSQNSEPVQEPTPQPTQEEEEASKPRRSKIPSPWKRGEAVDESSLQMEEPSGLFWQQAKRPATAGSRFGKEQKKRDFDLSALLGSKTSEPVSLTDKQDASTNALSDEVTELETMEGEGRYEASGVTFNEESISAIPVQRIPVNFGSSSIDPGFESSNLPADEEDEEDQEDDEEDEDEEDFLEESQPISVGDNSLDMSVMSKTESPHFSNGKEVVASRSPSEQPVSSLQPQSSWLGKLTRTFWTSNAPSWTSATPEPTQQIAELESIAPKHLKHASALTSSMTQPTVTSTIVTFNALPTPAASTISTKSTSFTSKVVTSTPQPTHPAAPSSRASLDHAPSSSTSTKHSAPLATSGYFSNDHYRALHKLYHKSKRHPEPSYFSSGSSASVFSTAPSKLLGQPVEYVASDGTVYSEKVTELWLALARRWIDDVRKADLALGGEGRVEWDEEAVCKRLLSIIVGERLREAEKRVREGKVAFA